MAIATVGKRVDHLETVMMQLAEAMRETQAQFARTDRQIERTEEHLTRNIERLSVEMREFKTEMRNEMREFKAEMLEFKNEMREDTRKFKAEMCEFKDEMREFKTESNKRWGELANKMGTMVEDLVAPSIERILRQTVGCAKEDVEAVAVRVQRRHPTTRQRREFDVVAACREYVLVNETKSKLNSEILTQFVTDCLPSVRDYFPEYANKRVIGAIASLYVDRSLVRHGERLGVIVLGFDEEVMAVLNSSEFVPKAF